MSKTIKNKIYSFLRRTEKYTKTDMIYLAKGSFWLTFVNIISSGLSLLMAIVSANYLLPEVYGTYKFAISVIGILSITTLTGMGSVISQAVSRGLEGSLFKAWRTKMAWGLLGGASSIGLSTYYYLNGNMELSAVFLIVAAFVPLMDSFILYQDYLQGKKLFSVQSIYLSISQTVATGLMIAAIILSGHIFVIIFTYLCSWTVIRAFFFMRTVREYPPNNKVDPHTIPYGRHTSIIDILATLIGSLDHILIFHYLGATDLALYSFAIAPIIQIMALFRNISVLAMPKMASRPIIEIQVLLKKRILAGIVVAIGIAGAYMLVAPFIYKIFFPQYLGSIGLSRLYALTILISIPLTVFSPATNSKVTSISKNLLYLWNIPGLLSTVFIFIFIQKIGIESVIFARILFLLATATIGSVIWRHIVKKDQEASVSSA